MFDENEVRRENEHRTDTAQMAEKELNLALLLVNSLTAQFDASKYRDGYREKLDALIAAKLEGKLSTETPARRPVPAVNILDALQRSLDSITQKPRVRESTGNTTRKTSRGK
jgi:DNA end-binding protein Ku